MVTANDVMKRAKESGVRFVHLQFTDIVGISKNVAIPVEQMEKALAGEMMFDGSSIEGFVRIEESDMTLVPDPETFTVLPWLTGEHTTARLICDVYTADGSVFSGCPRGILRKAMTKAKQMGFDMNAGPEPEFFLFLKSSGAPTTATHDDAGYFDLAPSDKGEEARRDMVLTLLKMGFEIEASHHEVAPGQHEIDFRYADALKTADNIATFRFVVKTIANAHDLHATFMPKPVYGICGSGMHLHQSLFSGGNSVFYAPEEEKGLSKLALQYVAGLMKHARAYTAVTNPLVNSYKRLVPGFEAPVYIAWSEQNRSPLIRIPARRGVGTRVELRSPDPSCNPYLAMAVTLRAGLDGIESGMMPPDSVNENIYALSKSERAERGIGQLPGTLGEALVEMEKSDLVKDALGEHVFERFITAKTIEWNQYREQVNEWEIEQYLTLF